MEFEFLISEKIYKASVEYKDGGYILDLGDRKFQVDFQPLTTNCYSLLIQNRTYTVYLAEDENKKYLSVGGEQFCVQPAQAVREKRILEEAGPMEGIQGVSAPMPGTVVKVNVSEGEAVEQNQGLVIVEAMKMENELRSPVKGYVKRIHVSTGDLVDTGKVIVELEAAEGPIHSAK